MQILWIFYIKNNIFRIDSSSILPPITTNASTKTHTAKQSTVAKGTCQPVLKHLPLTAVTNATNISIIIKANRCDFAPREIKHFIISQWYNKIGDSQQQRQQMDKTKNTHTHTNARSHTYSGQRKKYELCKTASETVKSKTNFEKVYSRKRRRIDMFYDAAKIVIVCWQCKKYNENVHRQRYIACF